MSRVAAVVVSHETRDEVLGCLATLRAAGADEVVVVDCGSTDGTVAAVRAGHPGVRVLPLANIGFGRGANAGVTRTSAPVVVVCNADVRFPAGAVAALADRLLADPALAAVGPKVRYPDGSPQASARRLPDLRTAALHAVLVRLWPRNRWTRAYRHLDAEPGPRDADWLSGCVLALRRAAFEQAGGFDPGYFLYVEDVDLGVRLREAGWRLRYEPAIEVVHRVGASTSRRRLRSLFHHARSLDRFAGKRWRGRPMLLLRPVLRVALAAWIVVTYLQERLWRDSRSTTGEPRRDR